MDDDNKQPDVPSRAPEVPQITNVPPTPSMVTPVVPTPNPSVGAPLGGRKKMKKGALAGIIAGAAVLLLGGGSVLAYTMWYQNPQKVVTNGIVNMMSAKSMTYTASLASDGDGADKNELKLDGATNGSTGLMNATLKTTTSDKTYDIKGTAIFDKKGDLYFKVGNIAELTDDYKMMLSSSASTMLDSIIAKVDDKWVKVSADDLKSVSEDASKTQTCTKKAIDRFTNDKKATKELGNLYAKNKFIKIDKQLGSKDGSLGYELKADGTKTKAFLTSLKDTKVYKELHDCDSSFTIDEDDLKDLSDKQTDDQAILEMWVSRWSHQITKISVKDGQKSKSDTKTSFVFEPKVGASAPIETPKSSTTIKQLSEDIEALMYDLTSSYSSPSSSSYNYDEYDDDNSSYNY